MKILLRRLAGIALLTLLAVVIWHDVQPAVETAILRTDKGDFTYRIEIADNPATRTKGLMYRKELADDAGMLFINERERVMSMWMKNTYLPLDMLFLKKDGTIAHIETNTTPLSEKHISSQVPVWGVIELNAGTAEKTGARPGDRIIHGRFVP